MTDAPAPTGRDLMPDMIRAFALLGIVMVNVETFASGIYGHAESALSGQADQASIWIVASLFASKSYSLFSLMFGAGLGYQMASAERAGVPLAPRYFRRITGLLCLGLLHAIFLFIGDILVTYAIMGAFLYLARSSGTRNLVAAGLIFIALQIAIIFLFSMSYEQPDPSPDEFWDVAEIYNAEMASGSFLSAADARLQLYPALLVFVILVQGLSAFGYFLLGLALFRSGLLGLPHHKVWFWCRWVALPLGLVFSILATMGYVTAGDGSPAAEVRYLGYLTAAALLSTFGYIGLIAKICQRPPGPALRFLARGGSATLTGYLMQSVLLCLFFNGAGLGWFGHVSAYQAALIAVACWGITLSFASIWRLRFRYGPMEYILRFWTYLGERRT